VQSWAGSWSRLHAALAALPLTVWSCFHLWEQWAAFRGREAWVLRMRATSRGAFPVALEITAVVLPLAVWAGLALVDVARRRPLPGTVGKHERGLPRAVGFVGPIATVVAIFFLVIHVGHLWGPKIVRGATELETWRALTVDLGRPWMLVLYAVGLSAVALHLAAALPAALRALGWIESEEARRSSYLVSSVLALCVWLLAAQLTGWLATGHGTFWNVAESDADDEPPVEPAP
jgi:succinate dehydrogenase/fumarate reductase cytochrome b subunit